MSGSSIIATTSRCTGKTTTRVLPLHLRIPHWSGPKVSIHCLLSASSLTPRSVDIGVSNVQIDSSLGYTNYMIWQDEDTTIRGANVTWAAENTKIAAGNGPNNLDTWTLQVNGNNVNAVRGTHLSITAVSNVGNGANLLAFLQETGNDVQMYTRNAFNSGAAWQSASLDPVPPSNSN